MRLLLVGNYGVGNLGDELLREYFLQEFPEVEWIVVSAHPEGEKEVPHIPAGVRSFLAFGWWKTVAAMRLCDAVVFGGGTLFTDVESARACTVWGLHAVAAWILRKPVFLAFQGIGPFHTAKGKRWAQWVIRKARFVSVRDALSFQRVQELVPGAHPVQSFDPVVLMIPEEKVSATESMILSIIPRHNMPTAFVEHVRQEYRRGYVGRDRLWRGAYSKVYILSLHPCNPGEQAACRTLQEALSSTELLEVRTLEGLLRHLRTSTFVISARFHGALAAWALDIPFHAVAQREGDKFAALTETGRREECVEKAREGERMLREALHQYTSFR